MAFRLAVLCALLAVTYGFALERVTGGEESDIQSAPWTCSIQYESNHIGGGAIVSHVHVITTASTVDELVAEALIVRVGSSLVDEGGLPKAVANVTSHPEYNQGVPSNNDIALIRLSFPLTFSDSIRAISIARWTGQGLPANSTLLLSGWQLPEDDEDSTEVSNAMQVAELRLVQRATCVAAHGNVTDGPAAGQPRVNSNMFCAVNVENGGNSACAGSNGSPAVLVSENATALVGVVSWATGCGTNSTPGVYTIVSTYFEWLRSVAGPRQPEQFVLQ